MRPPGRLGASVTMAAVIPLAAAFAAVASVGAW
jgi:hypothetical protein